MKPERKSKTLLAITQSKAKMYEYNVPLEHHINLPREPSRLFSLVIGLLGDAAVKIISSDNSKEDLIELKRNLEFSARFFDAYLQSRLDEDLNSYLLLLGASTYYLCDLPGSAIVLVNYLKEENLELNCDGLEKFLLSLLMPKFSSSVGISSNQFKEKLNSISALLATYYETGNNEERLIEESDQLRNLVYYKGNDRQLLLVDLICAIIKSRVYNSSWHCLPLYSDIDNKEWEGVIKKETFIKEFWPAQHLLGKKGVFKGKSAVVQMPTSAGKTKAIEIIIRSSFLAKRTELAVIVAPFRALCSEIRNSLSSSFRNEEVTIDAISDVMQKDFDITEMLTGKTVLVMTPEKLLYVLRHAPNLAQNIGLLIYDEGHQFDNGTRGINYELLLTTLKNKLNPEVQVVLISAVISNAEAIGDWLIDGESELISGRNLSPTYRTVAFTSWTDHLGRLQFVEQSSPDERQFFVPRVIEEHELNLKGKERKRRVFPDKNDGKTVAAYLGIKLSINGSVAVFCGTKTSVSSMCENIVDAYERGLSLQKPLHNSDMVEIQKIGYLYSCHLGNTNIYSRSAKLGILTHHGNTPIGVRASVEYAMKEGLANFVICTSTLAQGVNLPIRYLIITSIYQGAERLKVRDFHNLIGRAGRAGRAGMHTEGSIIFADPIIYDDSRTARTQRKQRRWNQIKGLLNPDNTEPSISTLSSIFEPLKSDDFKSEIIMEPLTFVKEYIMNPDYVKKISTDIASKFKNYSKEGLDKQINWKINIISAVESFLLAHLEDGDMEQGGIEDLASNTLAFYLANDQEKQQIIELFKVIALNIKSKIKDFKKRMVFGKTLFGLDKTLAIEEWVTNKITDLDTYNNQEDLLNVIWPVIDSNIQNSTYTKCSDKAVLSGVAIKWINGESFNNVLEFVWSSGAKLVTPKQKRDFKSDNIVEICENAIAYEGTLILGAIVEIINFNYPDKCDELIENIKVLQKRMKYGLPSTLAVLLYELGFCDRVISIDLCLELSSSSKLTKAKVIKHLKEKKDEIFNLLIKYPSYFSAVMKSITN